MKKNSRILSLSVLLPMFVLILITVAMVVLARGRSKMLDEQKIPLLEPLQEPEFHGEAEDAACLICYDGENSESVRLAGNAADIMTRLHVCYRKADLKTEEADLDSCKHLIFCSGDLSLFSEKTFEEFAAWLDTGDLILLSVPEINSRFRMIYRKMGIAGSNWAYINDIDSLTFEDDFIPGLKGKTFRDMAMCDVCLSVQLEKECRMHIKDADSSAPLVWSRKSPGGGTVTVFNNTLMYESYNFTGMIAAAYTEAEDVFVWPVINSEVIFIDDFPAPQPEGFDERLKEQFGYDTQSFFRNIWWPDMKKLADRHGLLYTGVLIEDYNENTSPPFVTGSADALIQYYGAELLNTGGEIALHGYNHQPLIPRGYRTLDNYEGWPSTENMALSLQELNRYSAKIFPGITFTAYVPPSNNLSEEGYGVLKENEKTVKVVSGVYYDEEDGTGYRTDFTETEDGIIQVPRISSEFSMEEQIRLRLYCMLYTQGVVSHFIHPDDVLDEERGAALGWEKLCEDFDSELTNIRNTYSGIRGLTATSTAAAVQRANRTSVSTENTENGLTIRIGNLEDEVWLALSCHDRKPLKAEGAEICKAVNGLYWLHCTKETVSIQWE